MKNYQMPEYKRSDDTSRVGRLVNTGIDQCLDLKYEEGVANFNKALDLDPENSDARYNKAVASLKWGFDNFIIGSKRYAVGIEILSHLPNVREDVIHEAKGFLQNFININLRLYRF